MIGVSLTLTSISSCNTRTKVKSEVETKDAVKKNIDSNVEESTSSTTTINGTATKTVDDYAKTNNLSIEYNPLFDTLGNLIPFHYSKDINGQKTVVSIVGNGKVVDTTVEDVKKQEEVFKVDFKEATETLHKRIEVLEEEIIKLSSIKTKDVKVAPDYIKYFIWIVILIFVLAATIIGLYIYFKNTIGKYKKILNL